MNIKNYHIAFLFLTGFSTVSCIKEIHHIGRSGTLVGYVTSLDRNQNIFPDQTGVTIRIEGGEEIISVQTDSQGKFEVLNLTTGTYDIELSRDGFGTHKIIGHTFVGGDNPSLVTSNLYELPDVTIVNFAVQNNSSESEVIMECEVFLDFSDEGPVSGNYRYYMGSTNEVSPFNYLETGVINSSTLQASFIFLKSVNTKIFPEGSTLHIVVYPCTESSQSYINIITGNMIFSTVKPDGSSVVSFVVPDI